jgi:tetratricopeptide (TPR) repeat protein
VAASLNNIAQLYVDQGKYAEAEPLFQRTLAIREQSLGVNHPDVAQTLNDLGKLYIAQSMYTQAELLLQRALTIREQVLEPDHPEKYSIQ